MLDVSAKLAVLYFNFLLISFFVHCSENIFVFYSCVNESDDLSFQN